MDTKKSKFVAKQVYHERNQGPDTRRELYTQLSKILGKPVISYFTSFTYPSVMISNDDADMLEGLLQECDLTEGFYLILSSPGGDGLAAERIINICRSYSQTGEFGVIVPGKAKSAATMISLGSSEIIMSKTSELGPVDPQIIIDNQRFSLYNLVKSYKSVFERAESSDGNLQPYMQQLSNYDSREIEEFISMCSLVRDIVIKTLKTGMLKDLTESEIEEKMEIFLTPKKVKVHGRPIYYNDIENCGLNIRVEDSKSDLWKLVYELYYRLNGAVSMNDTAKIIENENEWFGSKIIRG